MQKSDLIGKLCFGQWIEAEMYSFSSGSDMKDSRGFYSVIPNIDSIWEKDTFEVNDYCEWFWCSINGLDGIWLVCNYYTNYQGPYFVQVFRNIKLIENPECKLEEKKEESKTKSKIVPIKSKMMFIDDAAIE